jgi:hypothetical protein
MDNERIGRTGQIKIYIGKCFRLFLTEKQWKNLVSTGLIMLLICSVTGSGMFNEYAQTRKGAFAVICACIWIGLFNSIQSICRERDIIKREHRTGLHISSYIMAHVVYEGALCLAETFLVTVILCVRNIGHMPPSGLVFPMIIDLFLSLWLVIFGADMLALLVSCIVKTENSAMTVMPFVLIIQLIMSGMIFELSGITEIISAFTLSRWGLDAISAIANTKTNVNLGYHYSGASGCDATAGNLILLWMRLLLFALIYIIIAIIMLKKVDKDKR